MNISKAFFLMVLPAVTSPVFADVSAAITLVSDYRFRAITQTEEDPALQAQIDWNTDSGLYAGAFISNVDYGSDSNIELDVRLGFSRAISDDWAFDVGLVRYNYLPDGDDQDFNEYFAGLTYKNWSLTYWYTDDWANSGPKAQYVEANTSFPLPRDFSLNLHAGYAYGDMWEDIEYTDYYVEVAKAVGDWAFSLRWEDSSGKLKKYADCKDYCDGRIVALVSYQFPLGKNP